MLINIILTQHKHNFNKPHCQLHLNSVQTLQCFFNIYAKMQFRKLQSRKKLEVLAVLPVVGSVLSSYLQNESGIRFHSFRKEPLIEKFMRVKLGLRREKDVFRMGNDLTFRKTTKGEN